MSHTVEVTAAAQLNPPQPPAGPSLRRLFLLYHELRQAGSAYTYVIDTEMFGRHLDLYTQLRSRLNVPLPEITFDDGHISNLQLAAPRLRERSLHATFFITAGWTGKRAGYMNSSELRELHRDGHTIGGHGWSHALLTHCNAAQLRHELYDTRAALEDLLGADVSTMSLPGGRSNPRVLKAAAEAGYQHIFTSMPRAETLPLGTTPGRLNIRGDVQPEWLERLFAPDGKLLDRVARSSRRKQSLKTLLGDRLYFRLWSIFNRREAEEDPLP